MTGLVRLLANLGYGSRREVTALLRSGRVTDDQSVPIAADSTIDCRRVRIDGVALDPVAPLTIMLHKPAGIVCSRDDQGRTVYSLLPGRFIRRKPIFAPVGRLDKDTTGLLLLTDDGALSHRLTSPRRKVAKTYVVTLARPLTGDEAGVFASGTLSLRSEPKPLAPAHLETLTPTCAEVTVIEGRYHQIRRMFAAIGNHVVGLHRSAVGPLTLGDLPEGQWRSISDTELEVIEAESRSVSPT